MIVVTRHPALVELLKERGIIKDDVQVLEHATPEDVRRQDVVGVLPLSLACLTDTVTEVPLALSPEMRGKELDLETLRQIAGDAVTYYVRRAPEKVATYYWCDRLHNRNREPILILRDKDGHLHNFVGRPIEGVCKCRAVDRKQEGKWSHSKWEIRLLNDTVVVCDDVPGFETRRITRAETWAELAALWGVEEGHLREFLPTVSKETARFLSALEGD